MKTQRSFIPMNKQSKYRENKDPLLSINEKELLGELQKAYTSIGRLKNSMRHKKIALEIEKKMKKSER